MADNYLIGNVSGDIAHFRTALEEPLESCKVSFEPIQAGSGDPSPSNVRAISGWNGVSVTRCGKNLYDQTTRLGGYINASGTVVSDASSYHSPLIPVEVGKTYTFSGSALGTASGTGNKRLHGYNANGVWVQQLIYTSVAAYTQKDYAVTATIPSGIAYVAISYLINDSDVMLEQSESATTYEAYNGNNYTVSWQSTTGTVYGGYVDLATGELVQEYGRRVFTGSADDKISYYDTSDSRGMRHIFRTTVLDRIVKNNSFIHCYSNIAIPYTKGTADTDLLFYVGTPVTQVIFYIKESLCDPTVESFCTWLQEHNIDLVYPLVTPVHYQLTSQQINALKGVNNFWSTAGTIDVSYCFKDAPEMLKLRRQIELSSPHIEFATGTTASFKTDMVAPLKECKISFSPIQEGTGDPSPTNVRSIKGLNRLDVRHTSKNIVPLDGWTAQNGNDYGSKTLTNSYGTTLSTMDNSGTVTVTQSQYPESSDPTNYKNGFFDLISESLEFGKKYNISFDITNITNPLNVPLSTIQLISPAGAGSSTGENYVYNNNRYLCKGYVHNKYISIPNRNIDRIEIRNCGMSFTISNILITCADDNSIEYEDYQGESFIIDSPLEGKNIADVYGVSATNFATIYMKPASSNNYGTTISVNGDSIVVTQSQAPNTSTKNSYQNGYFSIGVNGLKFGEVYNVSFKISDIVSNPLDAQLSDILVYGPSGGGNEGYTVDGNRVSQKIQHLSIHRHYFEIRNCGMSFTLSEFMVTVDSETDQTYEPYKKTMYGGYIDLVNKEFVQNMAMLKFDGSSDEAWNREGLADGINFYIVRNNLSPLPKKGQYGNTSKLAFNMATVTNGTLKAGNGMISSSSGALNVYLGPVLNITTIEEWRTYLTNHPLQVVYELEAPIHYPLTVDTLRSFRSNNRIWSGDLEIITKYWTHHKDRHVAVWWNNMCNGYLSSDDWKDRNASETNTVFEDGIATVTFIAASGGYHTMVQKTTPSVTLNNVYYASYDYMLSVDGRTVGIEYAGGAQIADYSVTSKKDEWVHVKFRTLGKRTGGGAMYIPFIFGGECAGIVAKVKNPVYVDLTLMFGAGNEPATAEEFEQICMQNGVDLTQAQPYDAGTPLTWIV